MDKRVKRIRRARKARANIKRLGVVRLCVYRSLNNIYAQLIAPCGTKVMVSASSLEKAVRDKHKHCGNKAAAAAVGKLIAERGSKAGVKKVAFDRAGYQYHGRVSALAQAAREAGLDF